MPKTTPPPLRPIALLEDQPIDGRQGSDTLGMEGFARVVAGAAIGTKGPFTIGVYAGWGQGKSSLLTQAKALIDDDPEASRQTVTVWFDAWQYEREEHPLFPLLAAIIAAVEGRQAAGAMFGDLVSALKGLLAGLKLSASLRVPLVAEVAVDLDLSKAIEADHDLRPTALQQEAVYPQAFAALQKAAEGCQGKLVVFIDDLDRCLPANAVRLLEGIKLVLAQRGIVFVLALDHTIVEAYLAKRYREEFGVGDPQVARTYLHKLVQLELPIPEHRERFEGHLQRLLDTHEDTRALRQVSDLLTNLTDGSPRGLVRLVNSLVVDLRLWEAAVPSQEEEGAWTEADALSCMAVGHELLRRLGPGVFARLVRDQALCDALRQGQHEHKPDEVLRRLGPDYGADSRERNALVQALGGLTDVLHAAGRIWLEDEALRLRVYSFFRERDIVPNAPEAERLIVDRAVRRALGLDADAAIPPGLLGKVTDLVLSGESDLGDEGLRLLTSCVNLRALYLIRTQVCELSPLRKLTTLTHLDLAFTRVTDLSPLRQLTTIAGLSLTGTRVRDLGPLAGLHALEELSLANTAVDDLAPLSRLTSLTHLDLADTRIADLGPLHGLKALTELCVHGSGVADLAPIRELTGLTDLCLHATGVTDLAPLAGLTALSELDLRATPISSLAALCELAALTRLDLHATQVSDLTPLQSLTGLQWLDIASTRVSDLAPLAKLTGLKTLSVNEGQFAEAALEQLSAALPRLDIKRRCVTQR